MAKQRLAPGPVVWDDTRFLGQTLTNPLGLAAGFDKHGTLAGAAQQYGFGFVEVGSVTWEPHGGHPRPRMFRLDDRHLLNRMGLNGPGAEAVHANLDGVPPSYYGVSITKSNKPDILGERGLADILRTYRLMRDRGCYRVINLSCPNRHDGTTLEDPAMLHELLPELHTMVPGVANPPTFPWGVKLSPHRSKREMDATIAACEAHGCWFYILGNTQPHDHPKYGPGGCSGHSLLPLVLPRVSWLVGVTNKPVIACGGVATGLDAFLCQTAGATLVQAYTGFVRGPYAGPTFAQRVLTEWQSLPSAIGAFEEPDEVHQSD